jgi:PAS domain S-box-containing protein
MRRDSVEIDRGGLLQRLGAVVFRRAADSTLRFVDIDGPCAERMGLSKAVLTGDAYSFWTRVDASDRRRVLGVLEEAIRKGSAYRVSYRLQAANAPCRSVREEGAAVRDAAGEVVALEGVILEAGDELADARRDELLVDLQESQERFLAVARHAQEMIAEIRPDLLLGFVNERLCEELGRDAGSLRSCDPMSLIHPEDRDAVRVAASEALANGSSGEALCRLQRGDGSWLWAELRGCPLCPGTGEPRGVVTARKVEEERREEDALIERRLAEARIGKLSRRFFEIGSEGLDQAIDEAVESAGRIAGADRCYLMVLPSQHRFDTRTWVWQREGYEPWEIQVGAADVSRHAWLFDRLLAGEIVRIPSAASLGDEYAAAREHLVSHGIHSYCVIPVRDDGRVTAALGFHVLTGERDWSEHELALLRLVAELLAGALRRREIEDALGEGELRLQALAESAQDAIYEMDVESRKILYANPRYWEMHGYAEGDVGEASPWDFMPAEESEKMIRLHQAFMRGALGDNVAGTVVYRGRHRDGRTLWLEANGRLYRTASGAARGAAVVRDVTDREMDRRSMQRRLEDQGRIANLARDLLAVGLDDMDRGMTDGLASLVPISGADRSWLVAVDPTSDEIEVWEWADDGVVAPRLSLQGISLDPYDHARTLFEQGRELLITRDSDLLEAAAERAFLDARGARALLVIPLLSGRRVVAAVGFEMVDRAPAWTDETVALLRLGGEVFASALYRRRAEEALRESRTQLMQAQKMEAVGTLAGGVAHDFNNQLSVILGNARFVHGEVEGDDDLGEALTDLERAAEYCAQLTRQLLSFSRHLPAEPRATSVSKVLTDVAELTGPLLSSDIRFEASPHDGSDAVYVDETQLQQVLVNLVVNARDAMPDGGRLTISTRPRPVAEEEAERLRLPGPGDFVEFVVADTGFGMDEDTLARIFEPFFTTKEPGKGTGLGLATVYGILQESGGTISVESTLGVGTTFHLLLPLAGRPGEESALGGGGVQGGETLLLVDDEQSVRRLMRRMLGRIGFHVLEAESGEEALRLAEQHEGDIDVLVSDVSMPGMGGVELGRRLLERRPRLRVLLVTGHAEDDVSLPGARILCKPFRQEELELALDALLAASV